MKQHSLRLTLTLLALLSTVNTHSQNAVTPLVSSLLSKPLSVSDLFAKYQSSVYQIRVINEATGQKTSIGSGFTIGDGSIIATNYHVISDAIQHENRALYYTDSQDNEGTLTLLTVDVIHDLALLKANKVLAPALTFAEPPPQGEPLYALGNPHDLGFIIIDGINNGKLKKSARERILFSGSLTGGMSGGPTLNQSGEVVGINVSYLRQGNDISFIIPSTYLQKLLDTVQDDAEAPRDINQSIANQLFEDNRNYYQASLATVWPSTNIGVILY